MNLMDCPFCGEQAVIETTSSGTPVMKWVRCKSCEASAGAYSSASSAEAAWNTRFHYEQLGQIDQLSLEVMEIAKTGETPDGDGVNVPTLLWAEEWARKLTPNANVTGIAPAQEEQK